MNLALRFSAPPSDRLALVVHERSLTYGALADRVDRWRGGLLDAGLKPGDRVALFAGNNEILVIGYLAAVSAGLIAVPLNPQAPPAEIAREIGAVSPRGVIVGERGRPVWDAVDAVVRESVDRVFLADGSALPDLDGSEPVPIVDREDDEPAVLLFTSGTSGPSTPVILTHGNLASSLSSFRQVGLDQGTGHHVVLAVIPLFHVFGLNAVVNLGLMSGSTIVLEDHVAPIRTAELIAEHGVTLLAGPPTMWSAFLRLEQLDPSMFATLRVAVSGAAKLDPNLAEELEQRLGITVSEGYGLTETCATLASALGTDAPRGSVGHLLPGVEAKIVGPDGSGVLVGDPGELWVRGPMVSPGSWDQGKVVSNLTEDGWLRTGDLVVVDDQGHLAVVDRITDLIIVSGFNVHPAEVEQVLSEHPLVAQAGVLGEPDDIQGERIVAYVVAEGDEEPDPFELRDFVSSRIARYKVPKRIVVVNELPRGATGKLRRHAIERS